MKLKLPVKIVKKIPTDKLPLISTEPCTLVIDEEALILLKRALLRPYAPSPS